MYMEKRTAAGIYFKKTVIGIRVTGNRALKGAGRRPLRRAAA